MALDTVGILTPIEFAQEQTSVILPATREVFVDETPLIVRTPRSPIGSKTFTITSFDLRQRNFTVGVGGITNVATTLPVADASMFQVGDVLELTDGVNTERVEVTAAPNITPTPNTLTIRRAREGTTAAAFVAGNTLRLIGVSRTGGEIDQQAFRSTRTGIVQVVQTFQTSVQVGGEAEALSNVPMPGVGNSIFGTERAMKLREMMRDEEFTSYYGIGEIPAAVGDRGKQKGLKALIGTYNGGANVKTNAGAGYTKAAFLADTVQKIYDAGGIPDTIICSTNFLTGLSTWAPTQTAIMGDRRTNTLGLPITEFVLTLTGAPLTFIPSLQLRPGTAVVLTSSDVQIKELRPEQWVPRERRGDAMEGDWISSLCVSLGHPAWHSWVENITSFA